MGTQRHARFRAVKNADYKSAEFRIANTAAFCASNQQKGPSDIWLELVNVVKSLRPSC